MNFRFRHLRYFLAVAEELHFRRAANGLGVAQPALSRAIRDLEADLGVTLFERSNKKVELTNAGRAFQKDCREIWNAVDQAVSNVRYVHQGLIGSLRIGYTDMAIGGVLPSLLTEFQACEPGIVLTPHMDPTIYQLQRLSDDEIDIGFVTGPIGETEYQQLPVQRESFVCVVYDSHPLASRDSIRLEELAQERFILGPAREWEHFQSYLLPMCRRAGFLPKVVQEAYNTTGIIGLVACGMGVTVHTEGVQNYLRTGVKVVPIDDLTEKLETIAVWKPEDLPGPRQKFIDFLKAKMPGTDII
nr:LysR family transcriptional regulator [Ruegeria sp.]